VRRERRFQSSTSTSARRCWLQRNVSAQSATSATGEKRTLEPAEKIEEISEEYDCTDSPTIQNTTGFSLREAVGESRVTVLSRQPHGISDSNFLNYMLRNDVGGPEAIQVSCGGSV
jgi:hypothetical protein